MKYLRNMEHGTLFPRGLLFTNEPELQLPGMARAPALFMSFEQDDVSYLSCDKTLCSYRINHGLLVSGLRGFWLEFAVLLACLRGAFKRGDIRGLRTENVG